MFITSVPYWVSILLVLSMPIPIIMIARIAKLAAIKANLGEGKSSNIYWSIIIFYSIYLLYVSLMSICGVFTENSLPPKITSYTAVPLLLFFILVVSNSSIYKTLVTHIPLKELVRVHTFRFIGIFFLLAHFYGAIPAKFAYIAAIGDIATAFSSIFVAQSIENRKTHAIPLTVIWNIFGLLDIVSVLATAVITTKNAMETGSQNVLEMTKFPFSFIPSFAAATIIFLHITVFRKLWGKKFSEIED